jgi:hypothetical protein
MLKTSRGGFANLFKIAQFGGRTGDRGFRVWCSAWHAGVTAADQRWSLGAGAGEFGVGVTAEAVVVDGAVGDDVVAAELAAAAGVAGATGLGASTPAVPEPRPSFWRLGASSLPLELRPLSDWNFCMAATVFESHLPLGAPW